jgi:hypothetical protein
MAYSQSDADLGSFCITSFYKHKAEKAYRLYQLSAKQAKTSYIFGLKPIKYGIYQVFTGQQRDQSIFKPSKTRHTKSILSLHLCITLKLYSGKTGRPCRSNNEPADRRACTVRASRP